METIIGVIKGDIRVLDYSSGGGFQKIRGPLIVVGPIKGGSDY